MNAEEIVRALRCVQEKHRNDHLLTFQTDVSAMARDAADMIESLQAQLAASQRREKAAVEDFEGYMKNRSERCAYCIHDDECEPGESLCYANVCGFEWRGPQEAGKGDTECLDT